MKIFRAGVLTVALALLAGSALAQVTSQPSPYMPQRRDSVRPNSQNLMQGPSYWTPQQRRLNVPGATANPSLRRDTEPYPPPPLPPPVRPAETPDK